ncbi:MAG: hypothetical protein C0403_10295 [Desulfobacterium sp.]|nr:hypothetical protein [Desulfobacterium sp.]
MTGQEHSTELLQNEIDQLKKQITTLKNALATQKKTEEETLEKQTRYETLFEHADDAIFFETDIEDIVDVNEGACKMFGYSRDELLRMKSTQLFYSDGPFFSIYSNPALGSELPVEMTGIRKDNSTISLEYTITPLISGRNTVFMFIIRDVTKRKKAEEELKTTQEHLMESKKMAALGELVAGVAHEINTPIGIGVTGMSTLEDRTKAIVELYEQDDLSKEEFEQYLKTVTDASHAVLSNLHRAADLVRTFKQVAVDQSSEEHRKFKFKEYLNDILTSMQPKLKKTNHQITVNCPEDLELVSYPGAFSRIITNLIFNSLVHGFEGIEKGKIVFDISVNQDYFIIQYSDNGRGISPDVLEKIFDPFFTTKRGQGGTGLGMHIVYNLVSQTLNGKIKCSSTPGNGSQFLITIPIR